MTTHDTVWFAEQIGKSADWVYRHLREIPHRRIGRSIRFTDRDLADYLDAERDTVTIARALKDLLATTGKTPVSVALASIGMSLETYLAKAA